MRTQIKIWTVGLTSSALVQIVTPPTTAQASSKGTLREQTTKQRNPITEGSQKVADASKKLQEAMRIIATKHHYARAG